MARQREALRGLALRALALVLLQVTFSQANTLRRDFHQLIIGNKFDRRFER
jgi:hypothetical protein